MTWSLGEPIKIVIPGPPRAWQRAGHRVATAKSGKHYVHSYTKNETRDAQNNIKDFAQKAMNGRPPLDGPIDLRFVAFLPVPDSWSNKKKAAALADQIRPTTKPDFDNYSRMIDALKAIVWVDDSRVTDGFTWKRYSLQPRLVIEVRLLTWTP